MSKTRYIFREIFFYGGLALLCAMLAALMYLLSTWLSFILLGIAVAMLITVRKTVFWHGAVKGICWLIALSLCFGSMAVLRPEKNVSFESVLARESIRILTRLPKLTDYGYITESSDFISKLSVWGAPKGYSLREYDADGVPLELLTYDKADGEKVILQFHGGAYTMGLMDIYRQNALRYSKISGGASVASIDYRTAPAHTYPAALEDAEKGWLWLLSHGYKEENIIVAGDSAGGNLALALVMKLRDEGRPLPKALVLMSPWTDMSGGGQSYITNQNLDPIFGNKDGIVNNFRGDRNYYALGYELDDPRLSPAYGDFSGLPAMLIQVGTHEILESDSITVYEKASSEGVAVTLTRYQGMFHVFQLGGNLFKEGRAAWREVGTFVNNQFGTP